MKTVAGVIAGIVLTVIIGFGFMKSSASEMMFVERVSPFGYEETVEKVKQSYLDNGWEVLSVKDTDAGFVKKGKASVGKVTNMKVCQGRIAYEMLKEDANKHMITMMPCGVGIYEKEGKVYVATMNLSVMKSMFDGDVKRIMTQVAQETEKVMQVL